jgi:hypothetical protein
MSGSIFETDEFKPYAAQWAARQQELAHRQAYYDGTMYKNVRDRFMALGKLSAVLGPRVYRGTKALFLMLARAVDVDAGIIPGGWAFAEDAPEAWQTASKQVFDWSDWATDGVLYVHYGAEYGVTGLKVADLREQQRVVIKPLDPCCFMLVRSGQYDKTPRLAIIVESRCDDAGEDYEYAEVIEPERVRTFKDGEPMGVDGREAEYANALGFVPVVERYHVLTGKDLGEATAQKVFPLLDEINELASYLADIIKKHAEAQWMVAGAEPGDLTKSGDNVWFVPDPNGKVQAVVAAIDIPGVLAFIEAIRKEVQDGLPELAFAELTSKDNIATATLEIQLMELVLKVKRTRPNYDHGLADALRMAGRAAKSMNLAELGVLDDEALMFDPERPVLPLDKLTELEIKSREQAIEQQEKLLAAPTPEPQLPGSSRSVPQPETPQENQDGN